MTCSAVSKKIVTYIYSLKLMGVGSVRRVSVQPGNLVNLVSLLDNAFYSTEILSRNSFFMYITSS